MLLNNDRIKYKSIINDKVSTARLRKNKLRTTINERAKKVHLISLSFHLKWENFKEKNDTLETSKYENKIIRKRSDLYIKYSLKANDVDSKKITIETKNSAFAGVGSPMNFLVWASSILNFANRNAENIGINTTI